MQVDTGETKRGRNWESGQDPSWQELFHASGDPYSFQRLEPSMISSSNVDIIRPTVETGRRCLQIRWFRRLARHRFCSSSVGLSRKFCDPIVGTPTKCKTHDVIYGVGGRGDALLSSERLGRGRAQLHPAGAK